MHLPLKNVLVVLRNILFVHTEALKPVWHLLKYELLLMAGYAVIVISVSMAYTVTATVPGTSPDWKTVHITPKRNGYKVLNLFRICHLNDLRLRCFTSIFFPPYWDPRMNHYNSLWDLVIKMLEIRVITSILYVIINWKLQCQVIIFLPQAIPTKSRVSYSETEVQQEIEINFISSSPVLPDIITPFWHNTPKAKLSLNFWVRSVFYL